jgi:hypothetical protein
MSDLPAPIPKGAPASMKAEVASQIVLAWASGAKYAEACVAAGLTKGEAQALKQDPDWMAAWDRARTAFVTGGLKNIQAHGDKDWKATAWLLERIMPERFGKRDTVDQNLKITVLPFQSMLTGEVIEVVPEPKVEGVADRLQTGKSSIGDKE